MRYWDASAVVSLLVSDRFSARSRDLLAEDSRVATWWLTKVECASALSRIVRDGALAEDELSDCLSGLESLTNTWVEVQPISQVRSIALRLLRVHPLRAADAMQLASAIAVAAEDRRSISFVCYDDRLLRAADREGFPVLGATP
jgi:uncharacterized protein